MSESGPLIGILGGMGPQAGLDQAQKLVAMTPAESDQDHLSFVLFSMPGKVADRTAFLLGQTDVNPAHAIADQLEQMATLGVAVAAMACNTAHAAPIFDVVLDQLQARGVHIRILHLVDETVAHLRREYPDIGRVGVLGTRGAHQFGLYERALADAGLEAIVPDPAFREELLHAAVYDPGFGIKATSGAVSAQARELVSSAITHVRERGAAAVILGCTELPLAMNEPQYENIPVIDPARVVAARLTEVLAAG